MASNRFANRYRPKPGPEERVVKRTVLATNYHANPAQLWNGHTCTFSEPPRYGGWVPCCGRVASRPSFRPEYQQGVDEVREPKPSPPGHN